MARISDGGDLLKCSFCGKSQKQVRKLIAGPGVYICDECIDLCNEIIEEELVEEDPVRWDELPKPKAICDFLDDYAVHPALRNDLGLLWLVTFDDTGQPTVVEAVPLRLTFCHTTLAHGEDAQWVRQRFHEACTDLETDVTDQDGRLRVRINPP